MNIPCILQEIAPLASLPCSKSIKAIKNWQCWLTQEYIAFFFAGSVNTYLDNLKQFPDSSQCAATCEIDVKKVQRYSECILNVLPLPEELSWSDDFDNMTID